MNDALELVPWFSLSDEQLARALSPEAAAWQLECLGPLERDVLRALGAELAGVLGLSSEPDPAVFLQRALRSGELVLLDAQGPTSPARVLAAAPQTSARDVSSPPAAPSPSRLQPSAAPAVWGS